MAALLTLPNELLETIIHRVDRPVRHGYSDKNYSALVILCQVCKRLRSVCQPMLFSSFEQDGRSWRLRAFLRSIVTNPSLAENVRELVIYGWLAWDAESDERHKHYEDRRESRSYTVKQNLSDWRAFRHSLKVIDPPNKPYWRTAIRKNVDEVHIAILLLLLPNLPVHSCDNMTTLLVC